MNKQILTRYFLLISVLLISFAVAFTSVGTVKGSRSQQQSGGTEEETRSLVKAIREKGYREAARIKGNYVGTEPLRHWQQFDLESLTRYSTVVIVGTPLENVCRLNRDEEENEESITTDYQVLIQEVLKSNVQPGETITVSLPGGKVVFEDGTSAEIRTPGFRKMENGKSYVLFLTEKDSEKTVHFLTGGPQGLFELSYDGKGIKPHGRTIDEVVKKNKGKDVSAFLKEIRKSAAKYPESERCCK